MTPERAAAPAKAEAGGQVTDGDRLNGSTVTPVADATCHELVVGEIVVADLLGDEPRGVER